MTNEKKKEIFGGIVGEKFCYFQLRQSSKFQNVCHTFNTSIDRLLKIDMMWQNIQPKPEYFYGDAKCSIAYSSCAIEINHPFFFQNGNYMLIFPFKDEHFIYVVQGKALYEKILRHKHQLNHNYYVIKAEEISQSLNVKDWYKIPIVGKTKTFNDFFHANFSFNEVLNMKTKEEIIKYGETYVYDKCKDAIMNYDIPDESPPIMTTPSHIKKCIYCII